MRKHEPGHRGTKMMEILRDNMPTLLQLVQASQDHPECWLNTDCSLPGSGVPASVGVWCYPTICISLKPPDGVMLLIWGPYFDRAPNPNH